MKILSVISAGVLPVFVTVVLVYGYVKKVKVYEAFVAGARDGLRVVARLVPYLMAVFLAVGLFRDSGAMSLMAQMLRPVLQVIGIPTDVIPLVVVRPLSGAAGLGVVADIFRRHGPDSPVGFLASIMQGSTETTFYVLTVYFGAVGIRDTRHTLCAGLLADAAAFVIAAILAPLLI